MIIGYMRVTNINRVERKQQQLQEYGCNAIFYDKAFESTQNLSELNKMLDELQPGDTVVVYNLTDISYSGKHLFELLYRIQSKGASFKSLSDAWLDTTNDNPHSNFFSMVIEGMATFEQNLTRKRYEVSKKYNKNHEGMKRAVELYRQGEKSVKEICAITKVSRSSLYQHLKEIGY